MTTAFPQKPRRAEYAELVALFFIHGAALGMWFVPLSAVLDAHGLRSIKPFAFATSALAAIISPLIFGAIAVGIYFVVAGYLMHRLCMLTEFSRKLYSRMTLLQIVTLHTFLILMLSLPVKILIRLLFRIKYIWVTPWFSV